MSRFYRSIKKIISNTIHIVTEDILKKNLG